MKKRAILYIFVLSLLLAVFSLTTAAAEVTEETVVREPGQCGEDIYWSFDENAGTLTISGTGAMDDFYEYVPWDEYRNEITTVIFEGEVTYIGAYAFMDYDELEAVDFGDGLYEIGTQAFYDCDGLSVIGLPASFKIFGEESFRSCGNLTEIHCEGRFPSFRQNCLWDTYVTIYFPAESPWGVEYIQQLEEAFKGRVEFLASDGSDPYVPTEAAGETEETTVPTTEETTVPTEATVETTVPTTISTEETTGETTASTTEPTESTAPTAPTEPEEEEKAPKTGIFIGLMIVAAVLALLLLGILLFAPKNRGGKYRGR